MYNFRSSSISRGLQVETDDLIQFSSTNPSGKGPGNGQLPSNETNNNTKKTPAPLPKNAKAKNVVSNGRENQLCDPLDDDFVKDSGDIEDDRPESPTSARTADEQMDYLESLEPCPCYAKCCIDSIITLFCVTLLG